MEPNRIEELQVRLHKCETIVKELKVSEGWKYLVEDLAEAREGLDNNWHLIDPKTDEKKLNEFRITKLAINTLITTIEKYEQEIDRIKQDIQTHEEPDKFQGSDYDSN